MYLPSVDGCVAGITSVPTISRWMCPWQNQCTYSVSGSVPGIASIVYLPSVSGCVPGITHVPTLSQWMCPWNNQSTYPQLVDASLAQPPWHNQCTYPQSVDVSLASPEYLPSIGGYIPSTTSIYTTLA